jgi:hypothetical protein
MKLSKTIDQTCICKKSYGDPLGYFCMGLFVLIVPTDKWPTNFTCPTDVSTCPGQTLLSRPAINMSLHLDTLSWYRANPSLLFPPNGVSLNRETTNTNFKIFGLTRSGFEPAIHRSWGKNVNHYTTDLVQINKQWRIKNLHQSLTNIIT